MNIRLLTFKGCPSGPAADQLLKRVLQEEVIDDPVEQIEVPDLDTAHRERFLGSPSIQIDGLDIEIGRRTDPPCLGCRLYINDQGPGGLPPEDMIRAAIRRARQPKTKVLFFCTGNSCRSQMAEGWAKALKGDQIEPYSAGIETHGLNPSAVTVMAEAGVDISGHRSKLVSDLAGVEFDTVVTVCDNAYETCPRFSGKAKVVHAGFDDPPKLAREAKNEEEALGHYRRVRDEIRHYVEGLLESLK